jgi:hypothetical protein
VKHSSEHDSACIPQSIFLKSSLCLEITPFSYFLQFLFIDQDLLSYQFLYSPTPYPSKIDTTNTQVYIMEQINGNHPEKPRYIDFPCLKPGTRVEGKQALNRWSSTVTRGENFKLNGNAIADLLVFRP